MPPRLTPLIRVLRPSPRAVFPRSRPFNNHAYRPRRPPQTASDFSPFGPTSQTPQRQPPKPQLDPDLNPEVLLPRGAVFNANITPNPEGLITLIDENGQNAGVQRLGAVLRSLDQTTHVLHKVAEGEEETGPICRLHNLAKLADLKKKAYWAEREKKKAAKAAGVSAKKSGGETKELKMSWGISAHDLEYRRTKLEEFLNAGCRVEVLIAVKRGMAKVAMAQCEELVERVNDMVAELGGTEVSPMEGELGKMVKMFFKKHPST